MICIIHLCHDLKLWRSHAFFYVMCIGILSCYNKYKRVHYDLNIRYDIFLAISLCGFGNVSIRKLKGKPREYVYAPPGQSMCGYVARV